MKIELFKAPVKYMDAIKEKFVQMTAKKEGRPNMDTEHWGDEPGGQLGWGQFCTRVDN